MLEIEVVSDVMCPWCLIGKRRLEKALAAVPEIETTVRWRPFQLDATLPPEGLDRQTYLTNKFGDRASSFYDQIKQTGLSENIKFAFEDIAVSPNTLDAHRLIMWAEAAGCQDAAVEKLFVAYFVNGENIGDHEVLVPIAGECGMDADIVRDLLASDKDVATIEQDIGTAQQMGVSGVPCFIINNKYAISGAQEAETLVRAFRQISTETTTPA
jgi:predicted DsbA family dithiol-disulfide isomerase